MNEHNGNVFHGNVRIDGDNNPIVSGSHHAVGKNPSVHHMSARPDVDQHIAALLRLIAEHEHQLDDPEAVRSSATAIHAEAKKTTPNQGLLRVLLSGMTAAAGSVSAVAETIAKIRQTLGF